MNEKGLVVALDGGNAKVRFKRTSACGKCGACGLRPGDSEIVVDVPNTLGARVDDRVSVTINTGFALKASLIAYMFPLAMLIVGVVLGYVLNGLTGWFAASEVLAAILGLLFCIIAFFILKIVDRKLKSKLGRTYSMQAIIEEDEDGREHETV